LSSGRLVTSAGLLLGIGFGGFFDGIVLHQILQWHHMLTSTGDHPATTVVGLEANTLADGLFHAVALAASLSGLFLLWRASRDAPPPRARRLIGLMLAGWGAFNLLEGVVDHQLLTIHHVNYANVPLWDVLFLAFGAALLVGGWALARARTGHRRVAGRSVNQQAEHDGDWGADQGRPGERL